MTNIPTPSIYLCNRFSLEGGKTEAFFAGKERLMRGAWPRMKLLAACGERSFELGRNLPEPALKGMHIWQLDGWSALYEVMYELSEAKWYRALGDTLVSEDQDVLVNLTSGYGIEPRPAWQSETTPGYRYLHERLCLKRGVTMHAYLRELNWLAAELSRSGIKRTWCARHITGRPGRMCLLWRIPEEVDVYRALDGISAGASTGSRYAELMTTVSELERELLLPSYAERLDERIRAGESAPIVSGNVEPQPDGIPARTTSNYPSQWQ